MLAFAAGALAALALGLILSFGAGLHVLQSLGVDAGSLGPRIGNAALFNGVVTGLIVSGGTEGFNSIITFLGSAKDAKKSAAAAAGDSSSSLKSG